MDKTTALNKKEESFIKGLNQTLPSELASSPLEEESQKEQGSSVALVPNPIAGVQVRKTFNRRFIDAPNTWNPEEFVRNVEGCFAIFRREYLGKLSPTIVVLLDIILMKFQTVHDWGATIFVEVKEVSELRKCDYKNTKKQVKRDIYILKETRFKFDKKTIDALPKGLELMKGADISLFDKFLPTRGGYYISLGLTFQQLFTGHSCIRRDIADFAIDQKKHSKAYIIAGLFAQRRQWTRKNEDLSKEDAGNCLTVKYILEEAGYLTEGSAENCYTEKIIKRFERDMDAIPNSKWCYLDKNKNPIGRTPKPKVWREALVRLVRTINLDEYPSSKLTLN